MNGRDITEPAHRGRRSTRRCELLSASRLRTSPASRRNRLSSPLGLALPIPKYSPALNAASKVSRAEHVENLFNAADQAYEAARASKVQWTPEQIAQFKSDALASLKEAGHRDFTSSEGIPHAGRAEHDGSSNAGDVIAVRKTLVQAHQISRRKLCCRHRA